MKLFVYDKEFRLGHGLFASVGGYRLAEYAGHENLEAVPADDGCIYGTIYNMDDMSLGMMDAYYGIGVLHDRIKVTAILQGGAEVEVEMYEFIHAELV